MGLVEVVGVNSSLDIALQGGLAGLGMQVAVQLAQARTVRLELKSHESFGDAGRTDTSTEGDSANEVESVGTDSAGSIAVQCDGEPWLASPGTAIAVATAGRTPVVRPRIHEGHDVVRIVDEV